MPKFGISQQSFETLTAALPQGRVVCFDRHKHEAYTYDASSARLGNPSYIVYPQTQDEIKTILKWANTHKVVVVPRGTGTGKTGGAVPPEQSVIIAMEAFNRILEIDSVNRMAVVQPGVVLNTLQDAVEEKGLFYPPDPASLADCTIGGNVALNAGGPRCLKYGVTGHYVAGLEGVWANGEPFKLGGKLYKNVTGYDLMRLLIGSEGTLGIITKITLKLIQKPQVQADCHVVFSQVSDALQALRHIQEAGIQPATAELMDSLCIQAVEHYSKEKIPNADKIHCIFQLDGQNEAAINHEMEILVACCKQAGAITHQWAIGINESLWKIRRSISSALTAFSANKESHDITVPLSALPETMAYLSSLNTDPNVAVLGYGHMGDGNLHVNILNRGLDSQAWEERKAILEPKLFQFAVQVGGTISGEHGIGLSKKPYMKLMYDDSHLTLLKQIKRCIDPNTILNPHKIMD